jgi:hypothetical protein
MVPMPEEWMHHLCLDVVGGNRPFPTIAHADLADGDAVYVTIPLAKATAAGSEDDQDAPDDLEYALPGTFKAGADGAMSVQLFESGLWDREGFARVETVAVTEELKLRRAAQPVEAREAEHGSHGDEPIIAGYMNKNEDVVRVARDQIMDESRAFRGYLIPANGKIKEMDAPKWAILNGVVVRMANQMTKAQYLDARPADSSEKVPAPTAMEAATFKTDFLDPVLADLRTECESDEQIKEHKRVSTLRSASVLKYSCMMLDAMVNGLNEDVPAGQPDRDPDTAKLQVSVTALSNQMAVLSAQLRLVSAPGAAVGAPPVVGKPAGDAKAKILKVAGDGSCAYNVMYTGGAKSRNADAKLDFGPESLDRMSKLARKDVCLEANKVWLEDKEDFEGKYGPYQKFMETILEKDRDSDTWPEFCQWLFFARKHKGVEFRIKQTVEKDGVLGVQTYSTRIQDGPQPELVMFPRYRGNHYDIAAVEEGGELAYVFPASEADAAEALIDAFLKDSRPVKAFAKDLDEQELGQLLDGALGLAPNSQGEEAFTEVVGRQKKRQRKKADAEAKAAAAVKKAAARAEAEAEARMAKAAAKATTDILRQNGAWSQPLPRRPSGGGWSHSPTGGPGPAASPPPPAQWQNGAWSQPLPRRPGGGGWSHSPTGGPGPAASPPRPAQCARKEDRTEHVPAVVVFGDGSKKSLRRAIRALDPKVEATISAVYKIEAGVPRAVLHCAKEDLETVLAVLPVLKTDGIRCAAYEEQRGGRGRRNHEAFPPKAKQAERGLREASQRAGLCHYMAAGQDCPHSLRGQCKFTCYDQKRNAQRRQPPPGWRH